MDVGYVRGNTFSPIIFDNYVEIFTKYPFGSYFFNSFVIAILTTIISLPLAAMIAYAFAKFNTGGKFLRLFILSTQMIPPIIIVLPIFSIYLSLHLLNSYFGLIIAHTTIILPFLSWMLISFYSNQNFAKNLSIGVTLSGLLQLIILIFFTKRFYLPSINFFFKIGAAANGPIQFGQAKLRTRLNSKPFCS